MKPQATTKQRSRLLYGTRNVLRRWRKLRGRLHGKGPKDAVAWQRRMRRDRSVL